MKTNIGEFIAGAYYQVCLNAWPVIYNQPIYFREPGGSSVWIDGQEFRVGWSKADLLRLTGDELALEKREIDVVAIGAGTESETCDTSVTATDKSLTIDLSSGICFIAECTESDTLNRTYEEMRGKMMADVLLAAYREIDSNLKIEVWAPKIGDDLCSRLPELEREMSALFQKASDANDGGPTTLHVTPVQSDEYFRRIEELRSRAAEDTGNKLDNPFYRSLQLLARAKAHGCKT